MRYEQAFISDRAGVSIVDFLADELPLSKSRLKEAMNKGAVWLKAEDEEPQRIRRGKHPVRLGDEIHIYYDEDFLNLRIPPFECIDDQQQYSIWLKPEGMMAEESLFCDHLTLPRLIETQVPSDRDCYLLEPAAAEIGGLVLIVHTRNCASRFEQLIQQGDISLSYRVRVTGAVDISGDQVTLADGQQVGCTLINSSDYDNSSELLFEEAQGAELQLLEWLNEQKLAPAGLEDEIRLNCVQMAFVCPLAGIKKTVAA